MDAADSSPTLDELLAHGRWARGLARGLLSDADEAEDAVQEAWLAALRRPPTSRGAERPWLSRVLRNAVRQRARGEAARGERERAAARPEALPSSADLLEEVERQRVLVEEVLALEEPYRSVVILRYLKELDAAEVARLRGVPAGTVRSQLKRGLERLRERLDRRFGGVRAAWAVPLARTLDVPSPPVPAPGPAAPSPTSPSIPTLTGALTMQTSLKLALAAGALTLASATWMLLDVGAPAEGVARGALAAPAELARPEAERMADLERTPDVTGAPKRQVAHAPAEHAPEPPAEVAAAAAPEHAPADVQAVFVDELGAPVAGVRAVVVPDDEARAWRGAASEESGVDGRVALSVPLASARENFVLVYDADGFGRGAVGCFLSAGQTNTLGTITLLRDGVLAGRVLDLSGRPVAGASVWTRPAPLPETDEGQLARQGPYSEDAYDTGWKALLVETDETGAFSLDSVPTGELHVWAYKDGWRHGHSDELALSPGASLFGVEVRLEPLRPTDRITGRVLKPDGTALALKPLGFEFQDTNYGFSSSTMLDDEGRFDIVLQREVPHDFTVDGNGLEWAKKRVEGVEPGTRDLVIQLVEPPAIELVVRDRDDRPVPSFRYEIAEEPEEPNGWERSELQHDGTAWLAVPEGSFVVEVAADGFALGRIGPYDPGALPERLRVVLDPVPGIRGTVWAHGRPLEGAKVALLPEVDSRTLLVVNGFQSRVLSPVEEATSGSDGSYLLSARRAGTYYVSVTAEGLAPAVLGPFDHEPSVGSSGRDLRLDEGGTLEVLVRVPEGKSPSGVLVGVSDGFRDSRTARTDAQGRVSFELLLPGPWNVVEAQHEIRPYWSTSTMSDQQEEPVPEPPSTCRVERGRTTHFTLVVEE